MERFENEWKKRIEILEKKNRNISTKDIFCTFSMKTINKYIKISNCQFTYFNDVPMKHLCLNGIFQKRRINLFTKYWSFESYIKTKNAVKILKKKKKNHVPVFLLKSMKY